MTIAFLIFDVAAALFCVYIVAIQMPRDRRNHKKRMHQMNVDHCTRMTSYGQDYQQCMDRWEQS